MKKDNDNYTATISVKQSPDEVFAAVNNVRGWWSQEIDGRTDALGEVFKEVTQRASAHGYKIHEARK